MKNLCNIVLAGDLQCKLDLKFVLKLFFVFFLNTNLLATSKVDSLQQVIDTTSSDSVRVMALINLQVEERFNKERANTLLTHMLELAEKTKSNYLITMAIATHIRCIITTTKLNDSANVMVDKLLKRMEGEKYDFGVATAYKIKSIIYKVAELDSAVFFCLKSIEYFKKAQSQRDINISKINLGTLYSALGKNEDAIAITMECLPYAESKDDWYSLGTAHINLGNYYLSMNSYDKALVHMEKSLQCNQKRNDPYGISYAKAQIAGVYLKQNRVEEAKLLFDESYTEGVKINSSEIKFMAISGIMKVAELQKDWKRILSFDSDELDTVLTNQHDELSIVELVTKAYENTGDYHNAFITYKKYIELRESITNKERLLKADELQAKYETQEKITKIKLLEKERKITATEKRNQLVITFSAVALALLTGITGVVLVKRNTLKKEIESQQALLNERKKISNELHDDLSAQLSTAHYLLYQLSQTNEDEKSKGVLMNSVAIIKTALQDVRNVITDLQNTILQEQGLIKAIEELVNAVNSAEKIKFSLSYYGMEERLSNQIEHHLYRITQELLNNALKHSEAKNLTIEITRHASELIFMYDDDGVGINIENVVRGNGLSNIEHRTRLMKGEIDISSVAGKSTCINITIPIS